jgi:hypothetical protein
MNVATQNMCFLKNDRSYFISLFSHFRVPVCMCFCSPVYLSDFETFVYFHETLCERYTIREHTHVHTLPFHQ